MKYLELIKGQFTADHEARAKQEEPYVAYSEETGGVMYTFIPAPVVGPADNEIWYTTVDGSVVNPTILVDQTFGATITSNVYENGKGVVTFDGNVISIPGHSFQGMDALTSIDFPKCLELIADQAFSGCSNITSITIPRSVETIGGSVFINCSKLSNVIFEGTIEEWNLMMSKTYYSPWGSPGTRIPADTVSCIDGEVDLIFDTSAPF